MNKETKQRLIKLGLLEEQVDNANLFRANLTGANLTGAILTGADLTGARLTGAILTDARLTDARLDGARLTGAKLTGAILTGARLTGAKLTGAKLNWNSHDLISEILRQASGGDYEKLKIAGLVGMSRDWCWDYFIEEIDANESDDIKNWIIETLLKFENPPDELTDYLSDRKNES